MINQLVLDDATLMQLLGDPRVWSIVPSIKGRHDNWLRLQETATSAGCSSCQKNAIGQQQAQILTDVRGTLIGLPNSQKLQLKQILSARKLIIMLPSGGTITKYEL